MTNNCIPEGEKCQFSWIIVVFLREKNPIFPWIIIVFLREKIPIFSWIICLQLHQPLTLFAWAAELGIPPKTRRKPKQNPNPFSISIQTIFIFSLQFHQQYLFKMKGIFFLIYPILDKYWGKNWQYFSHVGKNINKLNFAAPYEPFQAADLTFVLHVPAVILIFFLKKELKTPCRWVQFFSWSLPPLSSFFFWFSPGGLWRVSVAVATPDPLSPAFFLSPHPPPASEQPWHDSGLPREMEKRSLEILGLSWGLRLGFFRIFPLSGLISLWECQISRDFPRGVTTFGAQRGESFHGLCWVSFWEESMGFDGFGVKISLRVSATSWDSWAGQGILPVCQRAGIGHCKTSKFGNSRDSQAKNTRWALKAELSGKNC